MKNKLTLLFLLIVGITRGMDIPESYRNAYEEILSMLAGKREMNFEKAVFVSENAYFNGNLSYSEFQTDLDKIEVQLNKFISDKNISSYKTCGQYAIFNYMTNSNNYNEFSSYKYNFEDFMGDSDWSNMFVTTLLHTKKGNCHSLPLLFKILSERLNSESFLALAPNHIYIKHLSEEGSWVNVELTNPSFPSDGWIMSSMAISSEAVRNGVYMKPLSAKESIAMCMLDLANNYIEQNGYDVFVEMCAENVLKHFPNNMYAIILKSNYLGELHKQENNYSIKIKYENKLLALYTKADSLGFQSMPKEQYEAWVKEFEKEKNNQLNQQ